MSKISADFGDTNVRIETEDRTAFDMFAALNHIFQKAGMPGVETEITARKWNDAVHIGPARGLHAHNMDFSV